MSCVGLLVHDFICQPWVCDFRCAAADNARVNRICFILKVEH